MAFALALEPLGALALGTDQLFLALSVQPLRAIDTGIGWAPVEVLALVALVLARPATLGGGGGGAASGFAALALDLLAARVLALFALEAGVVLATGLLPLPLQRVIARLPLFALRGLDLARAQALVAELSAELERLRGQS